MVKLMVHPEFANIEILIEIAKLNFTHVLLPASWDEPEEKIQGRPS